MDAEQLLSNIRCGTQDALKSNKAKDIADTVSDHYNVGVSSAWVYNLANSSDRGSRFDVSVRRAFAMKVFIEDWRAGKCPWLVK
jgi:hypothetical protein